MSRLTFCTKTKEAELSGAERAHMSLTISHMAVSERLFDEWGRERSWTRRLFPDNHHVHASASRYKCDAAVSLRLGHDTLLHPVTRERIDGFGLLLNTAWVLGSDVVRLMCRLHGQCEIHAYIPPGECAWVAGIIKSGLKSRALRANMGWDEVVQLLEESSDSGETVVTHYSVTDDFPGWDTEKDAPRGWDEHLSALSPTLCIQRAGWDDYRFDQGHTMMALEAATQPTATLDSR